MSGKGRQFYHGKLNLDNWTLATLTSGVPRIMEGTLPQAFEANDMDDDLTRAAKRWIQTARININTRQVFPPGFKR